MLYDNHTVKIESGPAAADLVRRIVSETIRAHPTLKKIRNVKFIVNVIQPYKAPPIGEGYIWFEDPKLTEAFGGTITMQVDPDWVPPPHPLGRPVTLEDYHSGLYSWADLEEYEQIEEATAPLIPVMTPPTVAFQPFRMDETMKRIYTQTLIRTNEHRTKKGLTPLPIPSVMPAEFTIKGSRAMAKEVDHGFSSYTIEARHVPIDVSEEYFRNLFRPFVSDPAATMMVRHDGKMQIEQYPIVIAKMFGVGASATNTVTVTFDPKTQDAVFARFIYEKCPIPDRSGVNTVTFKPQKL